MLGLVSRARVVLVLSGAVLRDLGDANLSDDEKEVAMRRHALRLLGAFAQITLISGSCLLLPVAVLWLLDRVGVCSFDTVVAMTLRWEFLLASTLAIGALLAVKRRFAAAAPAEAGGFENRYSAPERMLHEVAFAMTSTQLALGELEKRVFKRRLAGVAPRRPVFVTALPRAGTTLLLELCVQTGEFASHTYRDMPFVLMPMLWDRFARSFRKDGLPRERAHQDGMLVSIDSPEAFEEILWQRYWPRHYLRDRIEPWRDDELDPRFAELLREHLHKIVALRHRDRPSIDRYISKNNLNIARIGSLCRHLPDAIIVVPYRDPLQHAMSLLRQHQNFLAIHHRDPFARRYMADIGHFDFGDNLRPVDFDAWLGSVRSPDPTKLGFWVEYWTAAYLHLLRSAERHAAVHFLSYDRLCEQPQVGLATLAELIEMKDVATLLALRPRVRADPPREADLTSISGEVLEAARRCREELDRRALGAA